MNFNDPLDGEKRQLSKAGRSTRVALLRPDADRSGDDDALTSDAIYCLPGLVHVILPLSQSL